MTKILPVPVYWKVPYLLDLTPSMYYAPFVASAMSASWLRDSHASVACDFRRRTQCVSPLTLHPLFLSIGFRKRFPMEIFCPMYSCIGARPWIYASLRTCWVTATPDTRTPGAPRG